jgi:hypothetical protein
MKVRKGKQTRRVKKRASKRIGSRSSAQGKFVYADVLRTPNSAVREYVSPMSSRSIHRTAKTYAKALKSLAKR